jgi:serine/threonine protein kinase
MAKRVFDHDQSMYDLSSLQLDVVEDEETSLNDTNGNATRTFKAIGKGGFGSVYLGTIRKATSNMFFQAHDRYRLLGYYHDALLAVHPTNEHALKALRQGYVLDNVPIKVAVKRIEVMAEHELIREASSLNVLCGRRTFVTVYGPTRSQDLSCVCLVMDYVQGCNLNKFLQSRGTALDWDEGGARMCRVWESNEILWWMEKLKLFREIVIALIVCHSQKVYHGDLKGANILLDKTLVPKMVDFGLSFRRTDFNSYLRSMGFSLFWSAPEVSVDANEILDSEVVSDPYPSDVYSLGMVLAEMMLDGKIKESFTDGELFRADKFDDGCPVSLDHVSSPDALFTERVLTRLKDLIDRCCKAESTERMPLQECFTEVNDIYSEMFSFCSPSQCSSLYGRTDHVFTDTREYRDMVVRFQERFPKVPECIVLSPSWNMAMDEEENLLVHYFCKLDYAEGVQYIVEKGVWGFRPERDIPYLALVCVTEESLQTLKYLVASWPDVMEKQLFLMHKACLCNNPEIFQILLDARIDIDTWEEEIMGKDPQGGWKYHMKPIHKLAASGKTEMVRMILEKYCEVDPAYVNTTTPTRNVETPLYYAIEGGVNIEMVKFLSERGGIISPKALRERQDLDLHVGGLYQWARRNNISWLLGALCALAEEKEHLKTLEFFKTFSPGSAKVSKDFGFGRDVRVPSLGTSNGKTAPHAVYGVAKAYVRKILADFERGVSEEVISLHFHIEFPAQLAEACCEKGYLGILQFLEEYCGLDLNLLKENGGGGIQYSSGSLLHTAAFYGHVNIARFLLKRGYSVNSSFHYLGCSPLHRACESQVLKHNNEFQMVALLLNAEADPNYRDEGGYTAMDRVYGDTSKGSRDLVRLLLEAGFDCGQKNRWGEDYMDIISQIGTKDIKI